MRSQGIIIHGSKLAASLQLSQLENKLAVYWLTYGDRFPLTALSMKLRLCAGYKKGLKVKVPERKMY